MIEGLTRTIEKFAYLPVRLSDGETILFEKYLAIQECKLVIKLCIRAYPNLDAEYKELDWVTIYKIKSL